MDGKIPGHSSMIPKETVRLLPTALKTNCAYCLAVWNSGCFYVAFAVILIPGVDLAGALVRRTCFRPVGRLTGRHSRSWVPVNLRGGRYARDGDERSRMLGRLFQQMTKQLKGASVKPCPRHTRPRMTPPRLFDSVAQPSAHFGCCGLDPEGGSPL